MNILQVKKTLPFKQRQIIEQFNFSYSPLGKSFLKTKIDYIYKDIAEDIKIGFDTSSYELNIPLPKGKSKKVIG